MLGKLTLGIDIGTTNVKACVLDTETGKIVARGSREHPLFHPKPGWAEQDPDNYWRAVVAAIRECLDQGPFANSISGVSLSGLVGVTLPVDVDGRPLRPSMIWMDARSEPECQDIRNSVGEEAINRTNGNRVAPWFIEPKALWIACNGDWHSSGKVSAHIPFSRSSGRNHPGGSRRNWVARGCDGCRWRYGYQLCCAGLWCH